MTQVQDINPNAVVKVTHPQGHSDIVLVCEHASAHIPAELDNLGLSASACLSHAAWDPGALAVARQMSKQLDAVLVASRISRLVYDCNRPPEAPSATPAKSEAFIITGNMNLSEHDRIERAKTYYEPFRATLAQVIGQKPAPVIVTVHSFTPVYEGQNRPVEIGVLHDDDSRLADAMLATARAHSSARIERNEPYGPQDGVTHTLKLHALPERHLNVMLEVRNDLIERPEQQTAMGDMLSHWLIDALASTGAAQCRA